jgi:hypothetical protein
MLKNEIIKMKRWEAREILGLRETLNGEGQKKTAYDTVKALQPQSIVLFNQGGSKS